MNYTEAMEYMDGLKKYGSVLGLLNMRNLCDELENPQRDLRIIHIAGTNGKGSTGAFIDSILREAGYSTCRYVSPAVWEYEDILQYNGKNMTKDEAAKYITTVACAIEKMLKKGMAHPTPFEAETAMAFLYCRDKNCDFAILETGLGGREDAVNVIDKSEISVITSISMDHMQYLGNTLADIAYEKAGIIKENGKVVTAYQDREALGVIKNECRIKNARLLCTEKPLNVYGNVFDYEDMENIKISLDGTFQVQNAALAIEVCTELGISEEEIRAGLNNAKWRGRFEKICDEPVFIIDGAHNSAAAEELAKSIRAKFSGKRINYIMGVLADKEYEKIAEITAPLASCIFTVTPDNQRALKNTDLADAVKKYNKNVKAKSIEDAVRECMKDKDGVTIAFGSLSYLKDIIRVVDNEKMR